MVEGLSFIPGALPSGYIKALIPALDCRKVSIATQTEAFLMQGGTMNHFTTQEVSRNALSRSVRRFDELHRTMLKAQPYMQVITEQ